MKELKDRNIPYKIYLTEDEMPKYWYNVRADMTNKPAPLLNPATLKPMTAEELGGVFCTEYDTGAKIYVNYTESDVTVSGITVPAGDFIRIN